MSARPLQVGDRVRIVGWDTYGPHEGTITEIQPGKMRTDGFLAGVPRPAYIVTDCEYTLDSGSTALACAALNEDLTGAGWYGGQIELIEPVPALPQRVRSATLTPSYIDASPAPVSVVEYRCPIAGCDYMVGAAGPIDPDEPDYHAEDIEAHRASHLDDGRVHDVAEAERMAYDAEAEWSPVVPDPYAVDYARALIDPEPEGEPADIGEDDGEPVALSSQAGLSGIRHGVVQRVDAVDTVVQILTDHCDLMWREDERMYCMAECDYSEPVESATLADVRRHQAALIVAAIGGES